MRVNSITSFKLQNSNKIQVQKAQNSLLNSTTVDSVTFGNNFTLNYIVKRADEIALKAMKVQLHAGNIELEAANQQDQATWLKDCVIYEFERVATSKDGKINHPWGEKDVETLSTEVVDDRVLPRKFAKYTADGDINFEALFEEGKLSYVFVHNSDASKNIYEFDKNTGKLKQVTLGKTPTSFEEEYVYSLLNDELLSYKKGYKLHDDNTKTIDEIMVFQLDENDRSELTYYQQNRVQRLGNILEVGETFFFDDYQEYTFQEGYKKSLDGSIEQGETISMNKNKIQEYEQGFKQLKDGTKIHLPKMKTSNSGCMIELLDYGYSEKPNGEIERNNRVEMRGGIYHIILRMLGFVGGQNEN